MIARSDARSPDERSEIRDDREIPANRVRQAAPAFTASFIEDRHVVTARSIAMQPVKGRPLVAAHGAADAVVGVDLDRVVSHSLGSGAQLALLVVCSWSVVLTRRYEAARIGSP